MALYLIRHGETEGNAKRVLQHPETPLSERGVEQARRLAERLRGEGIRRVLASDYARAQATGEALAAAAAAPLLIDPLLRERNFGALRGQAYSALGFDPFAPDYAPPEGESWEHFHARVDRAWEQVRRHLAELAAAATDAHLAVVTHGLVCHSVVTRLARLAPGTPGLEAGWRNTSVTVIDADAPYQVRLLNCAAHLDDADAAGAGGRA